MSKLNAQVDQKLRAIYALGETRKEVKADKALDQIRIDEIRNDIFTLFRNEMEEVLEVMRSK